jgi:peptide/nickel transport system ATP-binding protein
MSMESVPSAALRGVSVLYQRGARKVPALSDVTFEVPRGRMVGLIGESGAGKSTVVGALLGLVQPQRGIVEVDGVDVSSLGRRKAALLRNNIQVVMQDPYGSLDPRWTVEQTIAEPMRAVARRAGAPTSTKSLAPRMDELLDQVRLPRSKRESLPRHLSGGERQRVAIARALSVSPSMLIADEPVTALDNTTTQQIITLLIDLNRETDIAMLVVAHGMSFIAQVTEEVHVMSAGRIVESGPTEQVLARPTHEYSQMLVKASSYLDGMATDAATQATPS